MSYVIVITLPFLLKAMQWLQMLVARNPESSSDVKNRRKLNAILVATRGDWIKKAGFEEDGNNKTYVWLMRLLTFNIAHTWSK